MTTTEKPRYRVNEVSWIHNTLQAEGAIVEYEGRPGAHMEPINDAARAAVAAAGPIAQPVVVPLVPVSPPPMPAIDWKEQARAAGWIPAEATGDALAGQAPVVQPVAEAIVEGKAGGAAAKLNPAPADTSADI